LLGIPLAKLSGQVPLSLPKFESALFAFYFKKGLNVKNIPQLSKINQLSITPATGPTLDDE
jgi:hypothetical protein